MLLGIDLHAHALEVGLIVALAGGCGRVDFDPIDDACALQHLVDAPYANSFDGADGVTTPFLICTAEQFARIGERPDDWDKAFVLGRDIDLAGTSLTMIGTMTTPFVGHFDGGSHALAHLSIDQPTVDRVGLFGSLGDGAYLGNVVLHAVDVHGANNVGALFGWADQNVVIEHMAVDGAIEGASYVGGVAGYSLCVSPGCSTIRMEDLAFDGSVIGMREIAGVLGGNYKEPNNMPAPFTSFRSSGLVHGDVRDCGGLVADMEAGHLDLSSSSASIECGTVAGGLVGDSVYGSTKITNSLATGSVTCTGDECAGLAGDIEGTIEHCHATGDVTCVNGCGGLVGENYQGISRSYATGRVRCLGDSCGGLAGAADGPVTECYATGDVTGNNDTAGLVAEYFGKELHDCYATGRVQGLFGSGGLLSSDGASPVTFQHVYSTSTVIGTDDVGGLFGLFGATNGNVTITDAFAAGSVQGNDALNTVSNTLGNTRGTTSFTRLYYVSACTNAAGSCTQLGAPVTVDTFYSAANAPFATWDFTTIWQEVPGSFPTLRNTAP